MNVHPESLENNQYFNYKGTIEAEARSLKSRQEKRILFMRLGSPRSKPVVKVLNWSNAGVLQRKG